MSSARLALMATIVGIVLPLRAPADIHLLVALGPWILTAAVGWALVLTWTVRRAQDVLLHRPGSRLAASVRSTGTPRRETDHAA